MPATGLWREIISNVRDRLLGWSNNDVIDVDCTAGGTIVLTVTQRYAAQLVRLTGTPGAGFTIEMADGNKQMEFENATSQTATIESATGAASPPSVTSGTTVLLQLRGTDFTVLGIVGLQVGALLHSGQVDPTGDIDLADFQIARPEFKDTALTRTAPSSSSGTLVLDLSLGNVFEVTLTEDVTTLTISNPPSSSGSFTLFAKQDGTGGWTITWPASVSWGKFSDKLLLENGVDSLLLEDGTGVLLLELTSTEGQTLDPDAKDIYSFVTVDVGTTWDAFVLGLDMK
jgi:hypothetical protein